MSKPNKDQYFVDIKVMNYILQGIPNDIYNFVDACSNGQKMWKRIKRLMQGSDISHQERHSRLINEFDKFVAVEGETLTSVYERISTLINVMDRNKVHPPAIAVNTKFLNSLQTEWSKYSIEEYDHNVQRNPGTESTLGNTNVQCYNYNEKVYYARECPKPKVRDAKYFREQMLLTLKDEAGVYLDDEENDFMLDNAYGNNTLEELNAAVIMMAHIQPTDDKSDAKPTYDAEFISEVNDLEQRHHKKLETIIYTSPDGQIDSDIIYDDPYVDSNSG
ncbi:hypothetical protein Tco_1389015 [Tanacetum coccineum]